jgi:hypothetical protein
VLANIDTIMLFVSVVLLGVAISTAWLVLRRAAEKRRKELQATATAAAAAQLQEWRNAGLLDMTDEDFRLALELGKYNPGQLRHLAGAIRRNIDEEELGPDTFNRLTVRVEQEDKPENTSKSESPKGHLELIAEFT